MKLQGIKLIIGLGNPGKEYEKTYHNVGFLAIDYLGNFQLPITDYQLLKNDVFMNESGKFVAKTLKKFGIKATELLIVHDDSDIELGKYKLSFNRGSAGHKGAESIIKSLGAKNFWRLRIGTRHGLTRTEHRPIRTGRVNQRIKAGVFVLKKISKEDLKILNQVFEEIVKRFN